MAGCGCMAARLVVPQVEVREPKTTRRQILEGTPFFLLHFVPLLALLPGIVVRPIDWVVCGALYFVRMFAITAFYHRYFSHRAFRTSRAMQFLFALAGASAVQRGPLWWASHHRHHHADGKLGDIHRSHGRQLCLPGTGRPI